jgi:hypothetical protein
MDRAWLRIGRRRQPPPRRAAARIIASMRRAPIVVVALAVVALLAGTASGAASGSAPAGVALRLTLRTRVLALHYTLRCEPTSGSLARAAQACGAIAANPNMVLGEPEPPHEGPVPLAAPVRIACPAPDETLELSGSFHGSPVTTTAADTCFGGRTLSRWTPFLPTPVYLHEVRVDQGLEPLQLGQRQASAASLLGPPSTGVGAANVYRALGGGVLQVHAGVPIIFAVAYDAHHRVATLIANDLPPVDDRWDLTRNPHPPSPLTRWHRVTCAGRRSLADHELSENRATTIVWPSADHPTAIVTNEPRTACRLAAATEQAPLPLG